MAADPIGYSEAVQAMIDSVSLPEIPQGFSIQIQNSWGADWTPQEPSPEELKIVDEWIRNNLPLIELYPAQRRIIASLIRNGNG